MKSFEVLKLYSCKVFMPLAEFYVRLEKNNIPDDRDNLAFKFGIETFIYDTVLMIRLYLYPQVDN